MMPSGCWEWTKSRSISGYGEIKLANGGGTRRAHRLAYELFNGPIPDGLVVMHTCDNPPCVNPLHLVAGTPKQNFDDARSKGRWKIRSGDSAPNRKLSSEKVEHILKKEMSATDYAKLYGVTKVTIQNVWLGRHWVDDEMRRYRARKKGK